MAWLPFSPSSRANETRWVVLDVESTGLDAARDRLLAIAAIGLRVDWSRKRLAMTPGDSFEAVLRHPARAWDRENILLHGIGVQRQREGKPPEDVLAAFAKFAGSSPLLAFHSAFDEAMIGRSLAAHGMGKLPNPWLDIAQLCAVTCEGGGARALDEWLAHFGIVCSARHQAAADALAECELLLRIFPRIAAQCSNWQDVRKLAGAHRWLRRAY
jgi:DNA polymerase III subunit epsilon